MSENKIIAGAQEAVEIARKLSRIRELVAEYPEPWVIETEPHDYKDGTTHFTHVRFHRERGGEKYTVGIGEYLTPDLAELLVLLREVAPLISMPAEQSSR